MKQFQMKWPVLLLAATTLFTACNKDDDEGEGNEEEVITTVTMKLTPVGGGSTIQFSYDDPDGPGGATPVLAPVTLPVNKQYNFELELLDKTKNPVANITTEVTAEGDEHRFYLIPAATSNLTISGLNNDANGMPLGTTGVLSTGAAANGTLRVVLRHYGGNPPNKATTDPVDSPKSSTDVDVTFNVTLQ
ncbi:hypothetical protein SAMN05444008_11585 [Cnuella takakiae]|uniref:Type 1 periplasmic binding fold superfamily protein n=1 Tax=Cnuella takakiae TaxID=1302690 RepID=A0A1M5G464_9BACT|nr:hypothetical protein [Cnuella takakiae]OLY92320.1 hypothetical protein BUE76_10740 [Cnuella takakiae]SHF98261.1 hypothetical protein SAMN05444008_11585 [Cnuella takakiae]